MQQDAGNAGFWVNDVDIPSMQGGWAGETGGKVHSQPVRLTHREVEWVRTQSSSHQRLGTGFQCLRGLVLGIQCPVHSTELCGT